MYHAYSAQPCRGDKTGEVRRRAASQRNNGVAPGEVRLPHDAPQKRRNLNPLGVLGVGNFREQHLDLTHQTFPNPRCLARHDGLVHQENFRHTGTETFAKLFPDAVADRDVVRVCALNGDGAHARASNCRAISSARESIVA